MSIQPPKKTPPSSDRDSADHTGAGGTGPAGEGPKAVPRQSSGDSAQPPAPAPAPTGRGGRSQSEHTSGGGSRGSNSTAGTTPTRPLGAGGTSYQRIEPGSQEASQIDPDADQSAGQVSKSGRKQGAEASDNADDQVLRRGGKRAAAVTAAAAPPVGAAVALMALMAWLKSFFFSAAAAALGLAQKLLLLGKGILKAVGSAIAAPFMAGGALLAKAAGSLLGAGSVLASAKVAAGALAASVLTTGAIAGGAVVDAVQSDPAKREGNLQAMCLPGDNVNAGAGSFTGEGVPAEAIPWIENAAGHSAYRIPAAFFAYIMDRESDFNPDVHADDRNGGTRGLFQMNRTVWADATDGGTWSSPDITNPMIHTEYGAKYFDDRLETVRTMRAKNPSKPYAKDLTELEALMIAHNAGEGNLQKYPNIPSITKGYLEEFRQKFEQYGGGTPSDTRGGTQNVSDASRSTELNLGAVKPHVQEAAEIIYARFDGVTSVGGYRPGNSRDPAGHPAGLALDFMVPLNAEGKATGDELSAWVQDNAEALNVKYIIWYQRIWSVDRAAEGWRPMEDRGNPTQNHLDHPHVSFLPSGSIGDLVDTMGYTPDECAEDTQNVNGPIGLADGGMTEEEAQKLVELYNREGDEFLRSIHKGGGPGQCNGSYVENCVSFSIYFMNKYTSFKQHAPGNGVKTASSIAKLTDRETTKTPTPYSVFSYANNGAGHTGVVLGIDGTDLIIGNAAYCQWPGRVDRIPQSKWQSWEFVDVSDLLTEQTVNA